MRTSKDRIAGLDVLRGFAAAAVMLHHHGQYYDVLFPGRTPFSVDLGPGHFGVELFFIVSGFVILMTIERKTLVRDFAISRAARLMPAFLAALVLATVILIVWPMAPLSDPTLLTAPTLRQFVANLTMAPSLLGETGVDLTYWTLTYELVFYVFMALLLRLGLLGSIEWLGLLAVALGWVLLATVDMQLHRRISIVLLVHYSNFFLIGICLYRIWAGAARPVTWLALAFAIVVSARGGGEQAFYPSGTLYLLLTAAFASLVWLATSKHGRWLTWPPLVFLGKISYPLYLIHVVLGFELIRLVTGRGWSTFDGVVAATILSLAAATLLHYFVEVPGERWLRTVFGPQRTPAAVVRRGSS